MACPLICCEDVAKFNYRQGIGSPQIVPAAELVNAVSISAANVQRCNDISVNDQHWSLAASVTTLCNCGFDIFRCWNKPTTQLHWLWEVRPARFASAERGLEQFGHNVFEFLVLMDSANFDFAHEFVRKIEGRFHFAIFPESCFSVNLAKHEAIN